MIALSRAVRTILDNEGFANAKIYASSGFDEFGIDAVVRADAPIDAFGVGTRVGVSADAPYMDIVYKLVRHGRRDVRKLSPGKVTLAGCKQLFRRRADDGNYQEDIIACRDEAIDGAEALLVPVMTGGRRLQTDVSLASARAHFKVEFACLAPRFKDIHQYAAYPVRISSQLKSRQPQ